MRVILSRKGFDAENGGYSSPILPNGRPVSLPIPSETDSIHYSDLRLDERTSYFDLMKQLRTEIKLNGRWVRLDRNSRCHCDPDIYQSALPRKMGWRPCFGQLEAAQTHLKSRHVKKGDVFLFFGWFRRASSVGGKLTFSNDSRDMHVIFGYLEIEDPKPLTNTSKIPDWMKGHPHVNLERRNEPTNTVYIATEKLSWKRSRPGGGVLNFNEDLVLTKRGFSRSKWDLPSFFKETDISYHSRNSWKDDHFQSAARGQEFVIEENGKVEDWTKELISKHAR